jgi:hypothetical protein
VDHFHFGVRGFEMIELEGGFGAQFSSFLLVFPLTERGRRANQSFPSRRAKETESATAAHALEVA